MPEQQQADDLVAVIREKVRAGILPKERPSRMWAGHGTGKTCNACEQPTTKHDVEHEIEMPDGRIFFFHQPCFGLWHQERATYLRG
jgi:hypothetical protein